MPDRALVTGSEGFVGRVLVRRLQAAGWDVVRSDFRGKDGVLLCDVGDAQQVASLFQQAGAITHVFHLAAQTFVPESQKNPNATFQTNLIGTANLVQSIAALDAPPRLIFISSADIYGPPQYLPMDEAHPLNPQNPYAISKAAADAHCRFAAKANGLDIVVMRPFNHSGAGQTAQFVLSSFAKQIAAIEAGQQDAVLKVGNLEAARDFSHVEDIVQAYLLAAKSGIAGEAYNVCSGISRRIQDALDSLLSLGKVEIKIVQDPARMRPAEVKEVTGACEKLKAATGWHATHNFDTMLKELLDYWRQCLEG